MDLKRKFEEKQQEIEKVLITLLFLTVVASLFFKENAMEINIGTILFQIILVLFYILLLQERLYAFFWLAFLFQITTYFFVEYLPVYVIYGLSILPFVSFGILILVKGFKLSFRNKSFELLTFIVGFLLVLQAALPFIQTNQEIITFYSFALAFSLGTIVYNDNLWHRYSSDEKNLIKFILIVALGIVLQSSAKFI